MTIRVTLQPFTYEYITFKPSHKKWSDYSHGKPCELLLTDRALCITFMMGGGGKPVGSRFVASDLNFKSNDSTTAQSGDGGAIRLGKVETESLKRIVEIQNGFSRRRRRIQLHIRNPKKRDGKLKETRGRQRNRVKDALHKLSSKQVRDNRDATFIFENLKNIGKNATRKGTPRSRKLRTYLNRWPYRMYQRMVQYKSRNRTIYVSPRGTSSECPVCGGVLEHPAWAISRCKTCGVDYDRDRLASLAMLQRGLRLCGRPFAVSADASWQPMRHEYLYPPGEPKAGKAGGAEAAASAPNRNVSNNFHEITHF